MTVKAIWGVLALFALGLSGCASAAEPTTLAPPVVTDTVSPAPSPPNSDAAASDADDEIVSAMERFFTAANAASRGEGIDEFGSLFAPSCALCATQQENFRTAYAAGQRADGDLYTSWTMEVQGNDGETALVTTVVDTGEITLLSPTGEVLEVFPAESELSTAWTLQRNPAGAWIVIAAQDLP